MIVGSFEKLGDSFASESWPETTATVTKSRDVGIAYESEGSSGGTNYAVKLHYRYEVEGQVYKGSKLAGGYHKQRADAKEKLVEFPEGTTITVYYKPEEPGTHVFVPGNNSSHWWGLIGSFALVGLGLYGLIFAFRFIIQKVVTQDSQSPPGADDGEEDW